MAPEIMDGILNIIKPGGITSHDVVQRVRRLLREKRVGHTGTLDPLATGVLVLCIGKATRIARFLEAGEKEYEAVMRLGITTDTLDSEGHALEAKEYEAPDMPRLLSVLNGFTGLIMQQPPAFSAIKVGGVPSYRLARSGKAEPHKPRPVTIHTIDLIHYQDPFISIRVRCSKGVYIRSLCADIGESLGAGSHMTCLVRTRSGRFTAENAVTLDQLEQICNEGELDRLLVPVDTALDTVPAVTLCETDSKRIAHGRRVAHPQSSAGAVESLVRIHDLAGKLVALARTGTNELVPEIVFSGSE